MQGLGWDEFIAPVQIQEQQTTWVGETKDLHQVQFSRLYTPASTDLSSASQDPHVFSVPFESSVLTSTLLTNKETSIIAFVLAQSRVASTIPLSASCGDLWTQLVIQQAILPEAYSYVP